MIPTFVLLLLGLCLLFSALLGIAALLVRFYSWRGYLLRSRQGKVDASPESRTTPLGTFRLRRVTFNPPPEEGVRRAQARVYVKEPGEEPRREESA